MGKVRLLVADHEFQRGGVILVLFGLVPKMAQVVASVPTFVLGGAGLVMFGMVTATGIRILAGVNLEKKPNNLLIIAVSISDSSASPPQAKISPRLTSWFLRYDRFSVTPHARFNAVSMVAS